MRRFTLVFLGTLVCLVALAGCRHGCPKSNYAPCVFTYELLPECTAVRPECPTPRVVTPTGR